MEHLLRYALLALSKRLAPRWATFLRMLDDFDFRRDTARRNDQQVRKVLAARVSRRACGGVFSRGGRANRADGGSAARRHLALRNSKGPGRLTAVAQNRDRGNTAENRTEFLSHSPTVQRLFCDPFGRDRSLSKVPKFQALWANTATSSGENPSGQSE